MNKTVEVLHQLQDNQFSQQQAEAIVQAISGMQTGELATKEDLAKLRTEMAKLRGEIDLLKWMGGVILALQVAILLKLFLH